ncbi:MAG: hypothetical protein ACYCS1_11615 [Gammaproteobacteria bacterium]
MSALFYDPAKKLRYAPPPRLPHWLPQAIAEFVRKIAAREPAPQNLDAALWWHEDYGPRLKRLITHRDMERVWTRLAQAPLNPSIQAVPGNVESIRELFLVSYLRTAVYPGLPESFVESIPSCEEIQETLSDIARLTATLCDRLGGKTPDCDLFTPWLMLEAASGKVRSDPQLAPLRENLLWLQKVHENHYWRPGNPSIDDHLINLRAPFSSLNLQLESLGLLASIAAKEQPKTPKRSKTLYPRLLAQTLARLVASCLAGHYWQAIATTVTVSLALDPPFTESHVRSCIRDGAGKSRKSTPNHT